MQVSSHLANKVRFYSTITLLYLLPIGFGWYVVHPLPAFAGSKPVALTRQQQKPFIPRTKHPVSFVSGQPVRIVIPASGIDLPVDPGYYDSDTDTWTLAGERAQFAMVSTLANNQAGETFIYGHNNNYVFGALRHNTPAIGAVAQIYTDNGHVFEYVFTSSNSVGPEDLSVFDYYGPSELTIQTCTGSFNEFRTFYHFKFNRVAQ